MLKYCDFTPVDNNIPFYQFTQLKLQKTFSTEYSLYMNQYGQQIHVIKLNNLHQVQILDDLIVLNIIKTILGFAKFQNYYYCFASFKDVFSLEEIVKSHNNQNQNQNQNQNRCYQNTFFDQTFCISLIQGIFKIHKAFQNAKLFLKFLNPKDISIIQIINKKGKFKNKVKVGMIFPLNYNIFDKCMPQEVQKNYQFCSPQQIKYANNVQQLRNRDFKKSFLYALGMILLYCFGYKISREQRQKAKKNSKQLNKFIKGIRKQIKILHQGKFISKAMKLLLQNSQAMRDNAQVFKLKLYSNQFQSLRKIQSKYNSNLQQQNENLTSSQNNTPKKCNIYITQSQNLNKENSQKMTIDIRISKYTGSLSRSQKQIEDIRKTELYINTQNNTANMNRSNKSTQQMRNFKDKNELYQDQVGQNINIFLQSSKNLHKTHKNLSSQSMKKNNNNNLNFLNIRQVKKPLIKTQQSQDIIQHLQSPININFDDLSDNQNLNISRKSDNFDQQKYRQDEDISIDMKKLSKSTQSTKSPKFFQNISNLSNSSYININNNINKSQKIQSSKIIEQKQADQQQDNQNDNNINLVYNQNYQQQELQRQYINKQKKQYGQKLQQQKQQHDKIAQKYQRKNIKQSKINFSENQGQTITNIKNFHQNSQNFQHDIQFLDQINYPKQIQISKQNQNLLSSQNSRKQDNILRISLQSKSKVLFGIIIGLFLFYGIIDISMS